MTITVKIEHCGPDHHDIVVMTAHPETGEIHGVPVRLQCGMSAFISVWDGQGIAVREIAKEPATQATGGIGEVGVTITPSTTSGESD